MILPFAHKDEMGIIGCCLMGGQDTAIDAIEAVPTDAFSDERLSQLFACISSLVLHGKPVDQSMVVKEWSNQEKSPIPIELLMQCQDDVPSPANLPYYVDGMIEAWRKRKLITTCSDLLSHAQNPASKADTLIANAESSLYAEDVKTVKTIDGKQAGTRLIDDLERRFKLHGALSGISTGFPKLDLLTDGLQPSEVTLIGARPSMGKTALGLNILHHACLKNSIPTLFASLEMSTEAIMRRLASLDTEMTMNDIRRGTYTDAQFRKFSAFRSTVNKSPVYFVDGVSGIGVSQLTATIRRHVRKYGIKLVIIDYLQKIKPAERHEKRTYEIGEVSGLIKAMAVQTKTAVVCLAQLNRESEKDKGRPPRLSDLADSGQIERDADTVALIHRDRMDSNGDAKLIIAKQRDGETGMVEFKFNGAFCRFESATKVQSEDYPSRGNYD